MTDVAQNMTPGAPAAGWYPDPADPNAKRWWSGAGWTDHVQSAPVAPVPIPVMPDAPLPAAVQPVVVQPAYTPVVHAQQAFAPATIAQPAIAQPALVQPATAEPVAAPAAVVTPTSLYAQPVSPQPLPPQSSIADAVIAQPAIAQQAVTPTPHAIVPAQPVAPALNPLNLDADGVPLNLFADSAATPEVFAPTASRPDTQSDWHSRGGRGAAVRRQSAGSVSLSTGGQTGTRKANPYERNWIAGLALVIAILSIPALGLRSVVELPPLTQSIFAGAPIALALLALVTSIRKSAGIVVSAIAVVIAGAVLAAGVFVDPAVLKSVVDSILALFP